MNEKIVKCPYCGIEIENIDFIDNEFTDDKTYHTTVIGTCSKCYRAFIWEEVFEYIHFKNFREYAN